MHCQLYVSPMYSALPARVGTKFKLQRQPRLGSFVCSHTEYRVIKRKNLSVYWFSTNYLFIYLVQIYHRQSSVVRSTWNVLQGLITISTEVCCCDKAQEIRGEGIVQILLRHIFAQYGANVEVRCTSVLCPRSFATHTDAQFPKQRANVWSIIA